MRVQYAAEKKSAVSAESAAEDIMMLLRHAVDILPCFSFEDARDIMRERIRKFSSAASISLLHFPPSFDYSRAGAIGRFTPSLRRISLVISAFAEIEPLCRFHFIHFRQLKMLC